jgi:hypothetical protein
LSIIYVVGGQQKEDATEKEEFHGFRKGVVLRVDTEKAEAEICLEYVSPPEVCPDNDPSVLFKVSTVNQGKIYLCTQTEILIHSFPAFERLGYLSLPCFNDIHHVRPTPQGNLLVANTGLDMVQEISLQGEILREWDMLDEPLWTRFSRDEDYRKLPTTKPHKSHPNYIFFVEEEIWVTRCEQKDAVSLTRRGRRIDIGIERAHDGKVHDGKVYFTTVNGHIVIADTASLKVLDVIKLGRQLKKPAWCRGLYVLDKNRVLVGLSRLRHTQWGANLSWLKGGVNVLKNLAVSPTSVALFDFKRRKFEWNIRLDIYGISAIFSIHPEEP